jgi:ketosteroid isomerase-like protein
MTAQTAILEKFNNAFAKGDTQYIAQQVTDDIVWNMVGDFTIKGKDAFVKNLQQMNGIETLDMQILNTISVGACAAVNGTMKVKEPSGNIKSFGFCDVYEFNSQENKIRKMTSYVLPVESDNLK